MRNYSSYWMILITSAKMGVSCGKKKATKKDKQQHIDRKKAEEMGRVAVDGLASRFAKQL